MGIPFEKLAPKACSCGQVMATDSLIHVIRAETRVKTLARDLQFIGQAMAEIASSTTTPYASKRFELDYWMARQAAVNNDLIAAKADLDAAHSANRSD